MRIHNLFFALSLSYPLSAAALVWSSAPPPTPLAVRQYALNDAHLTIQHGRSSETLEALEKRLMDPAPTASQKSVRVTVGANTLACRAHWSHTAPLLADLHGQCLYATPRSTQIEYHFVTLTGLPNPTDPTDHPIGDLDLRRFGVTPQFVLASSTGTPWQMQVAKTTPGAPPQEPIHQTLTTRGWKEIAISPTAALFTRGAQSLLFYQHRRMLLAIYQGDPS